jgi:hypothetical protein
MGRPVGTPEQFRWLKGIVGAILVLNVADALLTVFWVQQGRAEELNPFLRSLVHQQPALFVAAKFCLAALGAWLLWRLRKHRLAVVGLFLLFLAYYWVVAYHLFRSTPWFLAG